MVGGMSFLKKLFKKKKAIKYVSEDFLRKEYNKIKNNFENVMCCIGENSYYEIWVGLNKAIEVSMTLDNKILKINYFGEKVYIKEKD
jgi:hypothetical protein